MLLYFILEKFPLSDNKTRIHFIIKTQNIVNHYLTYAVTIHKTYLFNKISY